LSKNIEFAKDIHSIEHYLSAWNAYSENFDLIVLGVSHEIDNSGKWTTKLSAITVLKET
jgi:hypothetical protein